MNTSFKTGDKIELTEDYHSFGKKGDQGTVTLDGSNYSYNENDMVGIDIGNSKGLGTYTRRLKLVVPEYKYGDKVQITIPAGDKEAFGGAYFQTGTGTVDQVHSNGKRLLVRGTAVKDGSGPWWVDTKFVTPLAEELPFEVGARVRSKAGYYGSDSEGVVTDLVPHIGGDITIAWDKGRALAGSTCGATRSKLEVIASPVVERPKAIPATETKPQIGDTIVAFWEAGGVETRRKGVIAKFDSDGTAVTDEGEYITHDYEQEEAAADSVFIVERAPKPEPVKELPEQFLLDAPVGECAHQGHFVFVKSSRDAWKLILSDGAVAQRTSAELLEQYSGIKIIK